MDASGRCEGVCRGISRCCIKPLPRTVTGSRPTPVGSSVVTVRNIPLYASYISPFRHRPRSFMSFWSILRRGLLNSPPFRANAMAQPQQQIGHSASDVQSPPGAGVKPRRCCRALPGISSGRGSVACRPSIRKGKDRRCHGHRGERQPMSG